MEMKKYNLKRCREAFVLSRKKASDAQFWSDVRDEVGFDVGNSERTALDLTSDLLIGMQMPAKPCRILIRPSDSSCLVMVVNADPSSKRFGTYDKAVVWAKNAIVVPPLHMFGLSVVDNAGGGVHSVAIAALDGRIYSNGIVATSMEELMSRGLFAGFDLSGRSQAVLSGGVQVEELKFTRESIRNALRGGSGGKDS